MVLISVFLKCFVLLKKRGDLSFIIFILWILKVFKEKCYMEVLLFGDKIEVGNIILYKFWFINLNL